MGAMMKLGLKASVVNNVISALYAIVLWITKHSSPMQLTTARHLYQNLRKFKLYPNNNLLISPPLSPAASPPSPLSLSSTRPPSPWSDSVGDLLGMENGVYWSSNEDLLSIDQTKPYRDNSPRRRKKVGNTLGDHKREYPPPIPLISQARNLTREYVDGRLIMRAQKAKHYEYLEAIRENGRLTLNLVPLDEENDIADDGVGFGQTKLATTALNVGIETIG